MAGKLKLPEVYPNDVNLLHFMFMIARNDRLLQTFLTEVQFIRDRPNMTEAQVRRELRRIERTRELPKMPHKPTGTA